jgi:hypothetical protein
LLCGAANLTVWTLKNSCKYIYPVHATDAHVQVSRNPSPSMHMLMH